MFAQLGEIKFEGLKGFEGWQTNRGATFAEVGLIGSKPRLQRTGDALDELRLSVRFHANFCNPVDELAALSDYMKAGEILGLVLGTGEFLGNFVIETLGETVEQTDGDGFIFIAVVEIGLKEFFDPDPARRQVERDKLNAFGNDERKIVPINPLSVPLPPVAQISKNTRDAAASARRADELTKKAATDLQKAKAYLQEAKKQIQKAKEKADAAAEIVNELATVAATAPGLYNQLLQVGTNAGAAIQAIATGDVGNALPAVQNLLNSSSTAVNLLNPIDVILTRRGG